MAYYIALSFGLIVLWRCGVSAGTIVHPEIAINQSTLGNSGTNPIDERGYQQGPTGAVEIPGVLDIVPGGSDWPNFTTASQLLQTYTVQSVKLVKQTPVQSVCPGRFPQSTIMQVGSGIRLHWPLMYDSPGTTFTLTIDYSTPLDIRLPGETTPSKQHREVWKWRVAAGVNEIGHVQNLLHSMPFGRSGVPLVSDEALHSALKITLTQASAAYTAGDFAGLGSTLSIYRSGVSSAQIIAAPAYPNPTGAGTGIANTPDNPANCILLLDTAYVEPRLNDSTGSATVDAPDTTAIVFQTPVVVTYVDEGWFYAQNPNGIGGLKVIGSKEGLSAGMQVMLQGTMDTQGPERVLLMTDCEIVTPTPASPPTRPVGMPNRTVGGSGSDYLPGYAGMLGLWNGGLRIRTTGKVTDTGDGFFYIDDGSGSRDGTQYKGIRIILPNGVNPPTKNDYVAVTGISSRFDNEGYGFPAVQLGSSDDVTVIASGSPPPNH